MFKIEKARFFGWQDVSNQECENYRFYLGKAHISGRAALFLMGNKEVKWPFWTGGPAKTKNLKL